MSVNPDPRCYPCHDDIELPEGWNMIDGRQFDEARCRNCERLEAEIERLKRIEANLRECIRIRDSRTEELEKEIERLKAELHRDRTGLAQALASAVENAHASLWIVDGRGSYAWDDDEYRTETGRALRRTIEIASTALRKSGNIAQEALAPDAARKIGEPPQPTCEDCGQPLKSDEIEDDMGRCNLCAKANASYQDAHAEDTH